MPPGYYRYPNIYRDTVVYVCEDDLWTVPASGGMPRRLTSNLGEVSHPFFSPDGSLLSFVGREEGQAEMYVMPAQGGAARRLTYMGGGLCLNAGWTPDGKIIFADNAEHWYLRFTYLYTMLPSDNTPTLMNLGLARAIAFGPAGGIVLGRHTDEPARWKRYRGGTAGQLWIDPDGKGKFQPLLPGLGNLASPMWLDVPGTARSKKQGRIYFLSDHEGIGNLYSCLPSGKDIRRHSDHNKFYARSASTDGKRIVYHAGADLFLYDPASEENRVIPIEHHSPRVQRNRKFVDTARYLSDWTLHPRGQMTTITARGKLFSFANWEGAVIEHEFAQAIPGSEVKAPAPDDVQSFAPPIGQSGIQQAAIRFRLPRWLRDGKSLIAVTDASGEEAFVIFHTNNLADPQILSDLDIGRPTAIAVNPIKDQIVFTNHRYELLFLDLETRQLQLIDRSKAEPLHGFSWSPDGEWVAYSVSPDLDISILKLWRADSGETTPLTNSLLRDVYPSFDPQGKYLYFLSYRAFEPVYDNLHFDLNFPRGMRPHLITLRKDIPSPFILTPPVEEGENAPAKDRMGILETEAETSIEENGSASNPDAKSEEKEAETAAPPPPAASIQIDLDGIQQRVLAFPVSEGIYGRIMASRDGKVLYSRYPPESALRAMRQGPEPEANGTLLTYNFAEQKEETLINGISNFSLSGDRSTLIYRAGNRLRVLKAGEKPSNDNPSNPNSPNRRTGWLDLSRVKVMVAPGAEWQQMYREAWRLQRDQFWTPDMSQIDWLEVYQRYLPLVERVCSRSEFSDLIWEMQGELGTSHAYEFGGDYRPAPRYAVGHLGADYVYDERRQAWRITHIRQGDSWDAKADSPLNQPGVNIQVGDYLLGINGRPFSQSLTPDMALVNLANEEITLMVGKIDEQSTEPKPSIRKVNVITLADEAALRYREWVESNRAYVHEKTEGRIGYLHIPDMGAYGYAEFHRGYLAEVNRQGMIVDVRFNRGGHVSQLILEKLARQPMGYDLARWYSVPIPYPAQAVNGPMVALINENAGSDGDIFAHGFRMLGLGPLIGKRTWGGVIGINPRHRLVDGTQTTQPEYSTWFIDIGWQIENYGVDPDIDVSITPQDYAQGRDPQIERGIQEILKMLEAHPPKTPDFNDRPSRAAPTLPVRS